MSQIIRSYCRGEAEVDKHDLMLSHLPAEVYLFEGSGEDSRNK